MASFVLTVSSTELDDLHQAARAAGYDSTSNYVRVRLGLSQRGAGRRATYGYRDALRQAIAERKQGYVIAVSPNQVAACRTSYAVIGQAEGVFVRTSYDKAAGELTVTIEYPANALGGA